MATGNFFHSKQCAYLYCKLILAPCDISFLLIGCCEYLFWWYHTQSQYTLLCSQGLAQKMKTVRMQQLKLVWIIVRHCFAIPKRNISGFP